MLDGVFKCRNHFFDVRLQLATTLDVRPQRNRRGHNQRAVQRDRIEIVVEIWPLTAMESITRAPYPRPALPPVARPPDVRASLVGEEHIGATIETLRLTLQPPCAHGQRRQISIVGNDHKYVDVFGIRLGRHDGAQQGNSTDTGNLSSRYNESAQCVEQLLTVTLGNLVHRRFNPAAEPR
jgi:hypothetical protein